MKIFDLLEKSIELGASDIHLTAECPPIARVNGIFKNLSEDNLTHQDTEYISKSITTSENFQRLQKYGEIDFSLQVDNGNRFRVNIYKQKGQYAIAIRIIDSIVPKFNKLGLPNIISTFAEKYKGLILVTGATGSGKSTTLASLIDIINTNKEKHIITLEDPIEYIHKHKKSIISQREIGTDTESFKSALRATLRQDPDVILVGEMRDSETVSIALTAAETGHLVFSTLHTIGAIKTIDRIVDMFPSGQQNQIRMQLSTVIEGIISQQLIPTIDGNNRVVSAEVMIPTPAVRNLIRENKTYQIQNIIQTGAKLGMKSMDQELVNLYLDGKISRESVLSRCFDYDYTFRLIDSTNY